MVQNLFEPALDFPDISTKFKQKITASVIYRLFLYYLFCYKHVYVSCNKIVDCSSVVMECATPLMPTSNELWEKKFSTTWKKTHDRSKLEYPTKHKCAWPAVNYLYQKHLKWSYEVALSQRIVLLVNSARRKLYSPAYTNTALRSESSEYSSRTRWGAMFVEPHAFCLIELFGYLVLICKTE